MSVTRPLVTSITCSSVGGPFGDEWKAMRAPSGDQLGWPAFRPVRVSWRTLRPSASIT